MSEPGPQRLITPLFWLAVSVATWLSLRVPFSFLRSAWAPLLAAELAVLLCGFVIVQRTMHRSSRERSLRTDPDRLLEPAPHWPGFRTSCAVVGLMLTILVGYHLILGADAEPLGRRLSALAMTGIAAGSAVALLFLLNGGWNVNLAHLGMGLIALAVCCASLIVLPDRPTALEQRYPLILNALVVSLALTCWLWNWLSCVWQQQLDGGTAWTTAGRMIGPATRMAFLVGTAAVVVASAMAVWPRRSMVGTMDHSIGRVVAGVAGHLLLIWAVLWGARRVGQIRFLGLAVLATASMVLFVYVRTAPMLSSAR